MSNKIGAVWGFFKAKFVFSKIWLFVIIVFILICFKFFENGLTKKEFLKKPIQKIVFLASDAVKGFGPEKFDLKPPFAEKLNGNNLLSNKAKLTSAEKKQKYLEKLWADSQKETEQALNLRKELAQTEKPENLIFKLNSSLDLSAQLELINGKIEEDHEIGFFLLKLAMIRGQNAEQMEALIQVLFDQFFLKSERQKYSEIVMSLILHEKRIPKVLKKKLKARLRQELHFSENEMKTLEYTPTD